MFTSAELYAMNTYDVRLTRAVRKSIFSLWLRLPARHRVHSQWPTQRTTVDPRNDDAVTDDVTVGCVNAQSVGNKSATLSHAIIANHLDVLVVTETWHEDSESTSLKRVVPPGFGCIDATRPLTPDAPVDSLYTSRTMAVWRSFIVTPLCSGRNVLTLAS